MTLSETIELIEKAMEGVTPGKWESEHGSAYGPVMSYNVSANTRKVLSPVVCHIVDHPEAKANAAYIAACSPDRMGVVLAAAREAEALTGIGSAHDLVGDWLGEGTDDLPDDTPVRIEIGKRTIIADTLGSLRRALLSKESDDAGGSAISTSDTSEGSK